MDEESPSEDFAKLIAALAVLYRRPADEPMIWSYWIALHDVPIDQLAEATRQAMRSCRYLPVPATLREFAGEYARVSADSRLAYTYLPTDRTPESDRQARIDMRKTCPNLPPLEDEG